METTGRAEQRRPNTSTTRNASHYNARETYSSRRTSHRTTRWHHVKHEEYDEIDRSVIDDKENAPDKEEQTSSTNGRSNNKFSFSRRSKCANQLGLDSLVPSEERYGRVI